MGWYAQDKIHIICPKCGAPLALSVLIQSIQVYADEVDVQLGKAAVQHKCEIVDQ